MCIVAYKKEISTGVVKQFYMVVAEAINRYTGRRVQKKRRSIPSIAKAQLIYKELWSACRETRPDGVGFTHWGTLLDSYREQLQKKVRSEENPMGLSPHTIKCKRARLAHTDAWAATHLELVTPKLVTDELDEMERRGMTRQNTNEVLKEIKCVFAYGVATGGLKVNPFAGTKLRKAPKKKLPALTHEETGTLLREAKLRGHAYYYVWLLTIALGLRRSELAGLQWLDIDFNRGLIHVQRQLLPREGLVLQLKDGEDRVVAIPKDIIPVLKELKLRAISEFVIELDCFYWKYGLQAQVLRKFCKEIGIKELTHHRLRATHITLALADAVPLAIVKENVGHARLQTTDGYFSSSGLQMIGQMDKLRVPIPNDTEAAIFDLATHQVATSKG
jgi:integrase